MEIEPATLGQVSRMGNGRMVFVDDDVSNVVRDLRAIDPGLRVRWSEEEEIFVIYFFHLDENGDPEEKLVTTARALDQRIVRRIREINRPGYDFVAELDRLEREAEAQRDYEFREKVGPTAERLAWALRQDLGRHEIPNTRVSRAVIPKAIPEG